MAIAFRAAGTVTGADSGNVASIALPVGHALNDILLLTAVQFDNVASTVSGYTLIASQTNGASMTTRIFAKRDNGSEAAPTLTHSAGGVVHCVITAWSGVSNTLAVATPGVGSVFRDAQANTGTTASETFPANTGAVNGDMRVVHLAQAGTDTSGAATNNWTNPPTTFTERFDTGRVSATTGHVVSELSSVLSTGSAGSGLNTGNATGFAGTLNWIGYQLLISSDGTVIPYAFPTRIPNPNVGPMALRHNFRRVSKPLPQATTSIFQVSMTATATTSASIQNQVNKLVTATSTTSASIQKQVNKLVTATAATTASIQKQVNKVLTAPATTTASVQKQANKALTASSTTTASIQKQVNKFLTGTVTTLATVQKQVNKKLTATVTTTASLQALKVVVVTMIANVTTTASIQKQVNKALTATSTTTASIQRLVSKSLTATATTVASVTKQVNKSLTATATTTASMLTGSVFQKALTATVTTTASMQRQVNKALTATATTTAAMQRQINKTLQAVSTTLAIVNKTIPVRLTATVTTTASLVGTFIAAGGSVVRRGAKFFFGKRGYY